MSSFCGPLSSLLGITCDKFSDDVDGESGSANGDNGLLILGGGDGMSELGRRAIGVWIRAGLYLLSLLCLLLE